MDFKKATDILFSKVGHADLAEEMGVSVPLIRQARLSGEALAHRSPPDGWQKAVARLAEAKADRYRRLARALNRASD